MNYPPYPFTRFADRYIFVSTGKADIPKIVEFSSLTIVNLYNLCFGDLLPDGVIDDMVNSNNGDLIRVLSTVIEIIVDFIDKHPKSKIVFTGSTSRRTVLYHRILKIYYADFNSQFKITAYVMKDGGLAEVEFDPIAKAEYFAFLIEKK